MKVMSAERGLRAMRSGTLPDQRKVHKHRWRAVPRPFPEMDHIQVLGWQGTEEAGQVRNRDGEES